MPLDRMTLHSLTKMNDEIGVLSIYANADPSEVSTRNPAWHKRVHRELGQLKERLKAEGSRKRRLAVVKRLNALHGDLEWLLDRSEPGQGRALFAAVGDGEVRRVSLQVPLVDRVMFEPGARIQPLLEAWSAHGPAGAVAVGAERVRVVDVRFGSTTEIGGFSYQATAESREVKAPAAANPVLAQHGGSPHDLLARREAGRLARHLRAIGPHIAEQAARHDWDYLVLTGDAALVQAVVDGLPAGFRPDVVRLEHPVDTMSAPRLGALVAPALAEARHHRFAALARRARDGAMSGNAGACGLEKTLGALQERRVAHLLLAADGRWPGRRLPDGSLQPDGDDTGAYEAEPFLGERMIELAFGEGAGVTVLDRATAARLDDGVGAILRW